MQKKTNIKAKISHYDMAAAGEARLEQAGSSETDLAFLRMLTPTNASRSHAENVLRASVSTPAGLLFYICRMFFWPVAAWGLALRAALMPDCFVRHLPVKANANKRISSRSANAPSCEMMTFSLAGLFLNPSPILPDDRIRAFTASARFSAPPRTERPHFCTLEVERVTSAGLVLPNGR